MKPRLFVGSSSEGLSVAYALQENLQKDAEITVWDQGLAEPSDYILESLLAPLQTSDYAVFVFSPDDVAKIRGVESRIVRDNVLFELGLFVGRMGRQRSVLVAPADEDLRIPSDLHGMTILSFDPKRQDGNLSAALGPAANRIRTALRKIKPASPPAAAPAPEESTIGGVPAELKLPWFERRFRLSPMQQKLLAAIEDNEPMTAEQLMSQFPDCSRSELFYRVEQLRLLGFTRRTGDESDFVYSLTPSYGEAHAKVRSGRRDLLTTYEEQ